MPFFHGTLETMRTLPLLLIAAAALVAGPARALETGPYKDVTRGLDAATLRIALPAWQRPGQLLHWAFATGECGAERWAEGIDAEAFARANVAAAQAAGQRYVVSTGGALGIFTCGSDDGMARFVARYDSPLLAGLDFDIEGEQTVAQIRALVDRLVVLQARRPQLGVSFTLATHAGSDGARRGLNATGHQVLHALREAGLQRWVINLMVMNYGEADPRWCVVRAGRCDMGRSAVQAVRNLHERHGVPLSQIALTVMPGENDVAGNVFTPADARFVAAAARRMGLAGLYHWSIDRDQPCARGEPRVSPHCHALPGVGAGRFGRWLAPPR